MIRTIQSIKAFGIFNNFRWSSGLPEFKQFNLIYGWNYSGKTTLSRAFRCFEQKQPHMDFSDAQIQLKSEDGTIHNLSATHSAPVFRVFNSDFIHENLSFDIGSATPILVLGSEDIAKQETLKAKKTDREKLALNKDANVKKKEEIKFGIERALTNYARDFIKNALSVPNYDKTRFEPKVNKCKTNPEYYLLDENTLSQNLSTFRSTEKKPSLPAKEVSLSSIAEAKKKTADLIARIITANISIQRLKENPAVESWVKDGRQLHEGKDTCQFCGQPLPLDLMSRLTDHFSADYDNLISELEAWLKEIQAKQKEGITFDFSKGDFYVALQERFTIEKKRLDDLLKARESALAKLEEAVVVKQTKAFTSLECPVVNDPTEKITYAIEAINEIITEHNSRTAEFDKNREVAFDKLENHYAALFVRNEKYNEQVQHIADIKSTILEQSNKLKETDSDIRTLEQVLSEASKGAERINVLLAAYFGRNDLQIMVSEDKKFKIVRGDIVAKNLSEGEKTAIAFAFFITRVQDGRHPLTDIRVVIDDPVSSLDANHLFNTYALIKTQLAGCRQLFILTHSFEFYNLIRDWVAEDEKDYAKKSQANWKKWGVFLVKRTDDRKAVLEEIPKELLKFKSEYHYLFSMLYHFDKDLPNDFDCLLSLPNVVRRFMEAFGGIMIPLSMGLKKKMERLFMDEIERERIWKFINYYSHNTTITRSLTIPDMSECKAVVQACLKAVKNWNGDYFKDLEREVI
jgi:wobble nucleotide-excising tRNase